MLKERARIVTGGLFIVDLLLVTVAFLLLVLAAEQRALPPLA